jgi:NAD(P)-dependent dehydrogenase (short-subunit alcohol dehydrogenase family)
MPSQGITGKGIVVTGAARGIGAATARRLAGEGARTLIVDIDAAELAQVAGNLDGCEAFAADTSTEDGVSGYMLAANEHLGRIDGVFLNAGVGGEIALIADYKVEAFDRLVSINLRGTFLGMQAAIRQMVRDGTAGSIVATASALAAQGSQYFAPYVASKHAIMGLVRSAALEVGRHGIRVNALSPGYVATRLVDRAESFAAGADDVTGARQAFQAGVPLGRYSTPDEQASLATWLLSDESAYATGGGFPLDGGVGAGPYSG